METYIQRTLQKAIERANKSFPVLLVTGPRQVGKTTILQSMEQNQRKYVTLDDPLEKALAKSDPALFLQTHRPPVLIDEIQYAPELFPYIKMSVDTGRQPGMFWLTGSQQFHLMNNVSESLAGRIAILNLLGLSLSEVNGQADNAVPFLPNPAHISEAASTSRHLDLPELYERIWRGFFPFIVLHDDWEIFYKSYLLTYLQRDVRDLAQIGNERSFLNFLRATAARTGQLINYADLARDSNVSEPTAKTWLNILKASGIIYLLEPFHTNLTKRLVKTPKLYFLDTGLCSYLTAWTSPKVLATGAMSGAMLETFVVSEIVKSYWHNGLEAPIYFCRDRDNKEIDVIIEADGILHPIEIKRSAKADKDDIRNFSLLKNLNMPIGHGALICLREKPIPINDTVYAISASSI